MGQNSTEVAYGFGQLGSGFSDEAVEVINSMGILNAKGFKSLEYEGKIIFKGEVEFLTNE